MGPAPVMRMRFPAEGVPFRYGIIVCALRMFTEQFSHYYGQLLRALPSAPRKPAIEGSCCR